MLSKKQLLQSKQMAQVIITSTVKNNQNTSLINIQDMSPPLMT